MERVPSVGGGEGPGDRIPAASKIGATVLTGEEVFNRLYRDSVLPTRPHFALLGM